MTGPNDDGERERHDAAFDASDELAAYALDAVDPAERDAVERALAESARLRDETDAYAVTAAQLAELTPPVAPPADLRARLMASIDTTPQVTPDAATSSAATSTSDVPEARETPEAARGAATSDARDGAAPPDAPGERGPAHAQARRRWFQRPGALVAVAAAAVILLVGAVVGIGWPGPNGWGAQLQMTAIAEAPDAQTTTHEAEGGGEVTLVSSASKGQSVVVAEGLPDLGDDQTYELWYIDDAGAESAGTFNASGGETWRILDGSFTPGVAVGVTVEPAGGSPQPTTEPIVVIAT
ncbi:MAG TPA: anti-sigma factor [Agromyces sp.]|nr:anti-sigma factor [Agromyces sp.]